MLRILNNRVQNKAERVVLHDFFLVFYVTCPCVNSGLNIVKYYTV